MAKTALGMVETLGLNAAFEAADVAKKAANIDLIGYEISRGGLIVVKFTGDVGAVKAAVDAAKQAASKLSKVVGAHVIPRPHKDIDNMIRTDETVGYKKEKGEISEDNSFKQEQTPKETEGDSKISEDSSAENKEDDESDNEDLDDAEKESEKQTDDEDLNTEKDAKKVDEVEEVESDNKDEEDICNICGDPACPRRKGDLRKNCIHYDEIINDDN
ncbi:MULTISPECIES: BMC domain-containing protein [unclassified Halanaerobium]|uniref:BMC domain-containing protein n=1 Tax=unclassified Halanaerobium TaxID=2641197 RepID=UPI000DF41B82|nr:BMC domain-containing protein [Halanaerobium sp. MA284_MarDTE_T2]RCW88037.1 BMC domain-containing protein [Halanaerobium sp. DL-01]